MKEKVAKEALEILASAVADQGREFSENLDNLRASIEELDTRLGAIEDRFRAKHKAILPTPEKVKEIQERVKKAKESASQLSRPVRWEEDYA